jgi:hypothetical protein
MWCCVVAEQCKGAELLGRVLGIKAAPVVYNSGTRVLEGQCDVDVVSCLLALCDLMR